MLVSDTNNFGAQRLVSPMAVAQWSCRRWEGRLRDDMKEGTYRKQIGFIL